ncbi:peptidylprolyl isomerase [Trichloromonas sp.]|uniref:peptidylprolyl isomerase n=1 Tax=Trichloromonas sp. TaxID=3069249 RepID=UPI003D817491
MSTDIIAKVNGSPISRADFNNAVQGYAMELHRKTMEHLSADELSAIEELAIEKLVARELIYQEALSRGVLTTAEAVAAEIERLMKNFNSPEEFFATLEKAGIDQAAYQRMIRQDLTVNLLTEQQVAGLPEPDFEQVESVYQAHAEQMKQPPRVRACHILLKVRDGEREATRQRMVELRQRCLQEDFAELARDASDCPSAARGGDLGYFKQGDMVQSFSEAAFSQPVGEVGDIVESPFGFHLIKVLGREEGKALSLEEAAPKIRQFLKGEAASRHLQAWVDELKSSASIEMV